MGFSDIKPRYGAGSRAVAPRDKGVVLAEGKWIDESQARFHSISDQERWDAWATGEPLGRAADWMVNHLDPRDSRYVYRRFAIAAYNKGWSPLPETRDSDKRMPMAVYGKDGKRHAILPSNRRDKPQNWFELLEEAGNSGVQHGNLAMVIGPASGNVRVLDLDIVEDELAAAVYEIAMEELGFTPFQRVGRAPKIVLVYRMEGDDLKIPTHAYAFLDAAGQLDTLGDGDDVRVKNAIEFLGTGRNFTCYGLHHKTLKTFDWALGGLHPAIAGPEHAPLITKQQLNAFFTRVNKVRELTNFVDNPGSSSPTGGDSEFGKFEAYEGVWSPSPSNARGAWIVDSEGYVRRGREAYMAAVCWAMMSANMSMLRTDRGSAILLQHYKMAVVNRIVSEGKWSHPKAERECESKFASTRKKFDLSHAEFDRTGNYLLPALPWRIMEDGNRPFAQHAPGSPRPDDGSMDWLPEQPSIFTHLSDAQKVKGLIKVAQTKEQIAANKSDRALVAELSDREAIHARVAEGVRTAGEAFLEIVASEREANKLAPMHILMAPTGAGKTTIIIDAVGAFLRDNLRQPGDGPVLFMLPSHANIAEALQVAERTGMMVPNPSEIDEKEIVAALNANGVKAALLSGKRNHCLRLEDLEKLSAAGIGTAGLCGATIEEDGDSFAARKKRQAKQKVETTEVLCPFRERGECGYWRQMAEIETADIVFLPHSYLTMNNPPKVLKTARAVFVDESVVYRLVHFTEMRLDVLEKTRGAPWVTKAEQAENPSRSAKDLGEDMMQKREHIAAIVMKAFGERKCPAQAVIDEGATPMIRDAIKTVTRSHSVERDVNPRMTSEDITRFATRPAGLMLLEEEKFWRILEDRVANIRTLAARGDTDKRLFLFFKTETIVENSKARKVQVPYLRISWRSEMNWPSAPMMMLDASASPEIMKKCSGREITVHRIDAPLNVRTVAMIERPWSTRSFLPPESAEESEFVAARATIRKARELITKTAVSYAHGRVLVGTTIAVRQVLSQAGWTPPPNVDWVHFGALRGKDGFKHHVAAISIGRSEQPIGVIDGYAAALTFDDDVPDQPYDSLGTGLAPDGSLLFRKGQPRVIPMRSGHDLGHLVPVMAGTWAKILESQWREEELRQFLGRLRPVYRGGAPVDGVSDEVPIWICMSSTLPENIVVDELFMLDDIVAGGEFHDLMRLAGGVLADGITALLPNCRPVLGGRKMEEFTNEVLSQNVPLRERLLASMHLVRALIGGVPVNVRVAAWHADPLAAITEAVRIADAGHFSKVPIEILDVTMSVTARVTASHPAVPDRIDLAFADQAPFGDTVLLLEHRESQLRAIHVRLDAAGRAMDLEEIEQKWRAGKDLEQIVEREIGELERGLWVRMFDGEEIYEIMPHYLEAA